MCLLLRSDAYRMVGGFDERYHLYCEDVDLCLRLRVAGWSLRQVESATVIHAAQRASHRSLPYLGWHVSSLLKLWTSRVYWSYMAQRKTLRSGC
jgi:GT2 family glycosyltransferase